MSIYGITGNSTNVNFTFIVHIIIIDPTSPYVDIRIEIKWFTAPLICCGSCDKRLINNKDGSLLKKGNGTRIYLDQTVFWIFRVPCDVANTRTNPDRLTVIDVAMDKIGRAS